MVQTYDAIVIGARAAGSPTAMLLARRGHRVLLVDKATFPSDTISTHNLTLAAMASLKRWGLYDRAAATDCQPTNCLRMDFDGLKMEGWSGPLDGVDVMYNLRRDVLDTILVDAAAEAGADVRQGFTVDEIIVEDGVCRGIRGRDSDGSRIEARAPIVVGADGRHSHVAKAMNAEAYINIPALTFTYYSYFSGIDLEGRLELVDHERSTIVAQPTSRNQVMVAVLQPADRFKEFRKDIEGNFYKALALAPDLFERMKPATREERFVGTVDVQNVVKVPYGPGFALVGDAGLHHDPTLGQGITNAFRDAEFAAEAIDSGLRGDESMEVALRTYHEKRDAAVLPMFHLITGMVSGEAPEPEVAEALGALPGNQAQVDRFVGVMLGTVAVEDFFSPENLASIAASASDQHVESAGERERELVAA